MAVISPASMFFLPEQRPHAKGDELPRTFYEHVGSLPYLPSISSGVSLLLVLSRSRSHHDWTRDLALPPLSTSLASASTSQEAVIKSTRPVIDGPASRPWKQEVTVALAQRVRSWLLNQARFNSGRSVHSNACSSSSSFPFLLVVAPDCHDRRAEVAVGRITAKSRT